MKAKIKQFNKFKQKLKIRLKKSGQNLLKLGKKLKILIQKINKVKFKQKSKIRLPVCQIKKKYLNK